jgi:hypothetical protein
MRSSWPQPSAPPNHARCSMGPGLGVVCPPDWPAVASSSRAEPSGVDCLRFSPLSLRRPHCLCSGGLRHLLLKADEWMGGLPHREQQHGNRTTKSGKSHAAAPHSNRVTIAEQPFRTIRQRTSFSRIKMLPISPPSYQGSRVRSVQVQSTNCKHAPPIIAPSSCRMILLPATRSH